MVLVSFVGIIFFGVLIHYYDEGSGRFRTSVAGESARATRILPEDLSLCATINGLEAQLFARIKGQDPCHSPLLLGAQARSVRIAARREAAWFAPVSRSDRGREDGVGAGVFAFPFRRDSPFRFDMSEFLQLDSAKLFMGMNPANPGDSERSSLSTSKGFCFSTKSKRPIA